VSEDLANRVKDIHWEAQTMVHVRLAKDWTDSAGNAHAAGSTVDVDAATLAELEASGVVTEGGETDGWPGSSAGTDGWPGSS
jgi:hypothetical protein